MISPAIIAETVNGPAPPRTRTAPADESATTFPRASSTSTVPATDFAHTVPPARDTWILPPLSTPPANRPRNDFNVAAAGDAVHLAQRFHASRCSRRPLYTAQLHRWFPSNTSPRPYVRSHRRRSGRRQEVRRWYPLARRRIVNLDGPGLIVRRPETRSDTGPSLRSSSRPGPTRADTSRAEQIPRRNHSTIGSGPHAEFASSSDRARTLCRNTTPETIRRPCLARLYDAPEKISTRVTFVDHRPGLMCRKRSQNGPSCLRVLGVRAARLPQQQVLAVTQHCLKHLRRCLHEFQRALTFLPHVHILFTHNHLLKHADASGSTICSGNCACPLSRPCISRSIARIRIAGFASTDKHRPRLRELLLRR